MTATGTSEVFMIPGIEFPTTIHDIDVRAQSGPEGQNSSGTVAYSIGELTVAGQVTCLRVAGPDRGAGTPTAPTTAFVRFLGFGFLNLEVVLVDNGGGGADLFTAGGPPSSPDCSLPSGSPPSAVRLTNGRAVVFDAPPLPTSKEQCKNGGWRSFPQFKNQGQCIAFVEHHPTP